MNGAELVNAQVGVVPYLRVEEPHRAVLIAEVGALIGITRHRSKLVRVAEQNHLHSPERLVRLLACLPQRSVDRIEQIGVDHRHLVDDQGFYRVQQLAHVGRLLDRMVGDDADRQSKQRMDGLPADIERSHPGRRADHQLFRAVP